MTDNLMRPAGTEHVTQPKQCGARTRSGTPCKSAPVTGRRRCRMHGGADGSGAPEGSKNGNYKHGRYVGALPAPKWKNKSSEPIPTPRACWSRNLASRSVGKLADTCCST